MVNVRTSFLGIGLPSVCLVLGLYQLGRFAISPDVHRGFDGFLAPLIGAFGVFAAIQGFSKLWRERRSG